VEYRLIFSAPPTNSGRKGRDEETALPLRLCEIFMAVLRGGGVPARGQANQADVKSANNGELRATRRSIAEHREAKKVFMVSTKCIFMFLSELSCIVYSEFILLFPVNRHHTSA